MKESLTESPCLLRGDGWKFVEDGLGASHRTEGICFPGFEKTLRDFEEIPISFEKTLISFEKTYLVRLRRVHPLSWRTVMAVLEILT